jgi:hypothetical protein
VDSRPLDGEWRRRYNCKCGTKWSTLEVPASIEATGEGRVKLAFSAPPPMDVEPPASKRDLVEAIRKARLEGRTITEIAKALHKSRGTIEKYCVIYKIRKNFVTKPLASAA